MTLDIIKTLIIEKGLETATVELVKALIETHVKPLLSKYAKSEDEIEHYEKLQECIQEYLQITYRKAMIMNTIVFRDLRVPKTLCDLYIPLTLCAGDINSELLSIHERIDSKIEKEQYIINENYEKCISNYDKILIMDTAGMGKTTLVKYLAAQEINNNIRIPIIVELRKLMGNMSIIEYIISQFELFDKKVDEEDVIRMLKEGEFIIFFDGYDEVNEDYRGNILDDLQNFISLVGNNKYVVTSRRESDLSCLGDFYGFSIKPLQMEEAFSLIRKYDSNGEIGELLIDRIKNDKNLQIIKEFLINPLLVSLLYKTFDYNREIPYKKIEFYEQVYKALFNDHDKTKGSAYVHPKKCNLDIHDFERVLRRIGFISLQRKKIEFNRSELLQLIDNAILNMTWISVISSDFLNDITHAVPLFHLDGNDYKWTHKSFMEYFAAEYICYESEKPKELFKKLAESDNIENYENVLDFCFDIKPDIARETILYPHIKKFVEIYENQYLDSYYEQFEKARHYRRCIEFEYNILIFVLDRGGKTFKDRKNIDEIFAKYGKKIDCLYVMDGKIAIGRKMKNTVTINQILQRKGIDIFKEREESIFVPKEKSNTNIGESLAYQCEPYRLNDDVEAEVNSNENFELVTHLVDKMERVTLLDYRKCLQLCEKIENEKEVNMIMDWDLI